MKTPHLNHKPSATCSEGAATVSMITEPQSTRKPSAGRSLWEWWKRAGKAIGDFQARVLLVLFYFVILAPFALAIRWGSDPLALKAGAPRGWHPSRGEETNSLLDRATRQF